MRSTIATRSSLTSPSCSLDRAARERDPLPREVDAEDAYLHAVTDANDGAGILHEAVGELGDVHETVLFDAEIDEGAERRHVRDDAVEHHAGRDVFDRADVVAELRCFERSARVAPGLRQLASYVF